MRHRVSIGRHLVLSAVLLATTIAYLPSIGNNFTDYDDDKYVVENPYIRKLSAANLKVLTSEYFVGNYHPLTMLSYALNYRFGELDPKGYHITNLALHLADTGLTFLFVVMLGQGLVAAALVSLLFGIHPMHVESVAAIAHRKDVLYSLFFLGSLILYGRYCTQMRKRLYAGSLILFILSALSKGMAIVLPLILMLIDYLFERRRVLAEKLPFFIVSGIFLVVGIGAQESNPGTAFITGSLALHFNWAERLVFACYSLTQYVIKLIFPLNLSAFYPYPVSPEEPFPIGYWLYLLLVPALLTAGTIAFKKSRRVFFGLLFFILNLILVLKFVPLADALMADRYTYVSSIGIFFLIAIMCDRIIKRHPRAIPLLGLTIILYGGLLGFSTFRRCKVWKNSFTLWSDVINKHPEVPLAWNNRGQWKYETGDQKGAIADYEQAIALEPRYATPYNNRGAVRLDQQRYGEALADFERAIDLDAKNFVAFYNRGNVYFDYRDLSKALADYEKAIALNPNYADAHYNAGITKILLGNKKDGCWDLSKAWRLGFQKAEEVIQNNC
jgi:protein O-mannosyl-transferase